MGTVIYIKGAKVPFFVASLFISDRRVHQRKKRTWKEEKTRYDKEKNKKVFKRGESPLFCMKSNASNLKNDSFSFLIGILTIL